MDPGFDKVGFGSRNPSCRSGCMPLLALPFLPPPKPMQVGHTVGASRDLLKSPKQLRIALPPILAHRHVPFPSFAPFPHSLLLLFLQSGSGGTFIDIPAHSSQAMLGLGSVGAAATVISREWISLTYQLSSGAGVGRGYHPHPLLLWLS